MSNLYFPPVISSSRVTRSILLSFLAFIILTLILPDDAFSRSRTTTSGSLDTPYSDHGWSTKCTWENFQGTWEATPGDATDPSNPIPTQVTHFVGDKTVPHVSNLNYAVCAGFDTGAVPVGGLTNSDGTPNSDALDATYGWGYFYFDITYASDTVEPCILDANSGHGNSCGDDPDNTGSGGGKKDSGPTSDPASVTCETDISGVGTTLTYTFACAEGVSVDGFLTLVPIVTDPETGSTIPQRPPIFTECGPDRVAAGQCTILYGGFPLNRKGSLDANACLEAFPDSAVINGLNTNQTQYLAAGEVLLFQEVSNAGSCDLVTALPTAAGAAAAAYSRYCTSDIDSIADNAALDIYGELNVFGDDPTVDEIHGFDNEFRACFKRKSSPTYHTGVQDVERIELGDIMVGFGPTLNLNCGTGGNTDSGKYKVEISDQATLLAADVDVTLSNAPTLEGVSPISHVINTDDFGVDTLVLTYPTCNDLSGNVISNNSLTSDDNNTNVTLELIGQTTPTSTSLDRTIKALIEIKVNGL